MENHGGPTPDESSIKLKDNSNIMWSTKEIESHETWFDEMSIDDNTHPAGLDSRGECCGVGCWGKAPPVTTESELVSVDAIAAACKKNPSHMNELNRGWI